jgi:hypothetical protein
VFTPQDTGVNSPNSDTAYSVLWMDLRAEPIVLCMPEVEKGRYYSVQLVDMYTFNYGYIGSRATGNGAGCYLVAGPDWKGQTPKGVEKVLRSDTQFSLAAYRTQLFGPADLDNVKNVQAGYKVEPLSQFLKQPTSAQAARVEFPEMDQEIARADPFRYLNFVLQFCPPVPEERALRARFASIGVEGGKAFELVELSEEQRGAVLAGAKSGMKKIEQASRTLEKEMNGWQMGVTSGNRAFYHDDWLHRAAVALASTYANDAAEVLYPATHTDGKGATLDAATNRYTITFPPGQLPPVNAFWSIAMYDGKTHLLVANPIDRYLINSQMLSTLKKNADGSLTLSIQKDSPGADKEPNWLPAPNGTFYLIMRLYWPKPAALDGQWKPPAVQPAT